MKPILFNLILLAALLACGSENKIPSSSLQENDFGALMGLRTSIVGLNGGVFSLANGERYVPKASLGALFKGIKIGGGSALDLLNRNCVIRKDPLNEILLEIELDEGRSISLPVTHLVL